MRDETEEVVSGIALFTITLGVILFLLLAGVK